MVCEAEATNLVTRTLPRFYTPGVPVTVVLSNHFEQTEFFAYTTERAPANWVVISYPTSGFYFITSSVPHTLFAAMQPPGGGGFTSNVFSYTVLPPANESGIKSFSGNGYQTGWSRIILGDQQIEYDADGDGVADGPPLSIRVAVGEPGVSLCWLSVTNRSYQVQYTESLQPAQWLDLGTNMPGNGATNCLSDAAPAGQPGRYYRLVESPR
jgi:hypothetical protein